VVQPYCLAPQGHNVHLIDFTPSHIEQAKEYGKKHNLSLASLHKTERIPELMGISGHFFAIANK